MTRAATFVLALSLLAAFARGETDPPAVPEQAPHATGTCSEQDYRVGSGDTLEVVVLGHDDLTRVVSVRTDGALAFPLVGEVAVSGLPLSAVRERLTEALARYLVRPQVDLQVKAFNSRFVTLFGEVSQPGRRPLHGCTRVIDVLLQAGGFRDGASGEVVVSRAEGGEPLRARVERGVITPAVRQVLETVLQGGEILTVLPRAYVTVQGEVTRPSRYPIDGRLTVTGAVTLAGGLTRSGGTKVKIVRTGPAGERNVLEADLKAIRDGRAADPALQPDDIVTVPRRFF